MLLANKVCVITGAASRRGIGRAIAKLFALHGGRSVILDLDERQASDVAAELGDAHRGFACNVTDRDACFAAIERVAGEFGQVDVLINNAGITQPLKLMDIGPDNYDAVLDVNLRGTLYMSQAVIPQMRRQRSAPSSTCRRSPPSAAAVSSAARTTAPPKPACSVSARPWRASWVPTASASIR